MDIQPPHSTLPFVFTAPAKVAEFGVYLSIFGQLDAPYTPNGGTQFPKGSFVYFNGTDFALTTPSTPLPVLTLFAPRTYGREQSTTIQLPLATVKAGVLVIGVRNETVITVGSDGNPAPPTVATNPDQIFGLCEYSYLDRKLNLDFSEVDQVGFPFRITSDPHAPIPAQNGVGIIASLSRQALFQNFKEHADPSVRNNKAFLRCLPDGLTGNNQHRLLAPQTVLNTIETGSPTLNAVSYSKGGNLPVGKKFYYVITATGDKEDEESIPSQNYQMAVPYFDSGTGNSMQTVNLSWEPFPNAIGYNVYRSTAVNGLKLVNPVLLTHTKALAYSDSKIPNRGSRHPPSCNYDYDPLNSLFTNDIGKFFQHYKNNSFSIFVDGDQWTGKVVNEAPWTGNPHYTALKLSNNNTADVENKSLYILLPFFFTNVPRGIPQLPQMPTWMIEKQGTSPTESPGQMVFACDGVFQTGLFDPIAVKYNLVNVLNDIQNRIVSAFNRGIATNFEIAPDDWANFPLFASAVPLYTAGTLPPGTYYYVMTSIGDTNKESVTSLELSANVSTPNNSVMLKWIPLHMPTHPPTPPTAAKFNIYRGNKPGLHNELVATISNSIQDPPQSFLDKGENTKSKSPPYKYYPEDTSFNFYAEFLHQSEISTHGLAYAFAFDDQGGRSTDIGFDHVPNKIMINLNPWS